VLVAEGDEWRVDEPATRALRQRLAAGRRPAPFFDRGPGYRALAGRDHADLDVVDGR
jgi:N-methylhydantoinase B